VTQATENTHDTVESATGTLPLLADRAALLRVRVLPAEFARLLGVSKQSVSRWVKSGKVTINPMDGRLDVQAAIQQVLRNTDPGRLRSRALRQAVDEVKDLRLAMAAAEDRAEAAGAELAQAQARIAFLEAFTREGDAIHEAFITLVIRYEHVLRATNDADEWARIVAEIDDEAVSSGGQVPEDTCELVEAISPDEIKLLTETFDLDYSLHGAPFEQKGGEV
jgi:phage terminase Nu1 subunit (DNA packaging protein)